jgi:hypothetical protein
MKEHDTMITFRALSKLSFGLVLLGSALGGWIVPANAEDQSPPSAGSTVVDKSPAGELALWNSIKDSQNSADFLNYLDNFPNGMFADPARDRYEALSGQKFEPGAATETAKTPPEPQPTTEQPTTTAKVKAKAKPTSTVSLKSKQKKRTVSASGNLKKKPLKKSVAKVPAKKKTTVASKRKSCPAGTTGNNCSIVVTQKKRSTFGGDGGGGGGGGGSGGGSGGGWH